MAAANYSIGPNGGDDDSDDDYSDTDADANGYGSDNYMVNSGGAYNPTFGDQLDANGVSSFDAYGSGGIEDSEYYGEPDHLGVDMLQPTFKQPPSTAQPVRFAPRFNISYKPREANLQVPTAAAGEGYATAEKPRPQRRMMQPSFQLQNPNDAEALTAIKVGTHPALLHSVAASNLFSYYVY